MKTLQVTKIRTLQVTKIRTLQATKIQTLQVTRIQTLQVTKIWTLQIMKVSIRTFSLALSNGFIPRKLTKEVPGLCPVTYNWALFSCICISHIKEDNDWLHLSQLVVPESITGVLLLNWPCLNHSGNNLDWQAYSEKGCCR